MSAMDYLIPFGIILGISTISAILHNGKDMSFSGDVFMISISISIAILVWTSALPLYLIIVSILIIVGMIMSQNKGSAIDE